MNKTCSRCGTSCLIAKDTAADGSTQVFFWCVSCSRVADPLHPFISKDYLKLNLKVSIDSLPTIERYPNNAKPKCVVCGKPGAQLHHFAPKHLFNNDADRWPTGYLCQEHHDEWHNKLTPDMRKRPNGQ